MSNATPEQDAALDALEEKIDALTLEQRAALEAHLVANEVPPTSAEEAVALIPVVEKAIEIVKGVIPVEPVRNHAQTVGAAHPLQPLAR
jgi:hypothetical protein